MLAAVIYPLAFYFRLQYRMKSSVCFDNNGGLKKMTWLDVMYGKLGYEISCCKSKYSNIL